ncbi:hypothetical protein KR222_009376 [Zaprionus bogoriensis]|nr:hypothetical protein KR222_009376 [Zaprionus bogoriensis]
MLRMEPLGVCVLALLWLGCLAATEQGRQGGGYYINNGTHLLLYEQRFTPIVVYPADGQEEQQQEQEIQEQSTGQQQEPETELELDHEQFPTRIVNGVRISCKVAPYQAAVHHRGRFTCGGSILSRNWILTAAHCVDGTEGKGFTARVGSSQQRRGGQLHRVNLVVAHARYNSKNMQNDLALMRLERPVRFGSCVKRVKIPRSKKPKSLLVSGWGVSRASAVKAQRYLRGTMVDALSHKQCSKLYRKGGIKISRKMMCASRLNHDSCSGDSGGPLTDGRRLYGVVSFGIGCADHEYPGVYVDVSQYTDWINGVLRKHS